MSVGMTTSAVSRGSVRSGPRRSSRATGCPSLPAASRHRSHAAADAGILRFTWTALSSLCDPRPIVIALIVDTEDASRDHRARRVAWVPALSGRRGLGAAAGPVAGGPLTAKRHRGVSSAGVFFARPLVGSRWTAGQGPLAQKTPTLLNLPPRATRRSGWPTQAALRGHRRSPKRV